MPAATVSAVAGSVTQPGETIGVASGAPLAPGWCFVDTTDWGVRSTAAGKESLGVTIPVIVRSTPWSLWGARIQFLGAAPAAETGTLNNGNGNPLAQPYEYGFFNPFFAGQLAWDLGGGWGFSYLAGVYRHRDAGGL
jgi:Putative MetA-pathway of phenol degradation